MNLAPYKALREAKLSPLARRKSRRLTDRYLAALDLAGLREARELTQVQVARRMKVAQVTISRLERRKDFKFSTLRNVARALGGHLEIRFVFPKRSVVLLKHPPSRKSR